MDRVYDPVYFECMSVSWNLNLLSGPKAYIECGKCKGGFYKRLPLRSYPKIKCDCGAVNQIPFIYE